MLDAAADLLSDVTLVDIVVGVLALLAMVRGYRRGALSQTAVFAGALGGLVAGAWGGPRLAGQVIDGPGPSLALATIAVVLVAILVGQAVGLALGWRLRAAAQQVGAGWFDRGAGMMVGLAGMLLLAWLVAGMLVSGPSPRLAQAVEESRLAAAMDTVLPPPPDVIGRVAGYLDDQGFPQVVSGLSGGISAEPVDPASDESVQAAAEAGQPSTVQIHATGCRQVSSGSGFVTQDGYVVTNAHVIAGGERLAVRDAGGEREAVAVLFDPALDLAVLRAPTVEAPPIGWVEGPAERGVDGATLGFPGGGRDLVVKSAAIANRGEVTGRDIYGEGGADREVLTLSGEAGQGIQRGDSGGPFVTDDGRVAGVVFAANAARSGEGYALTAERVRDEVAAAVGRDEQVGTGRCRF